MERRNTKKIKVGNLFIGGDSPITVQSMLNKPAHNTEESVKQAVELEKAGCPIIRAAIKPAPKQIRITSFINNILVIKFRFPP